MGQRGWGLMQGVKGLTCKGVRWYISLEESRCRTNGIGSKSGVESRIKTN